MDEFVQPDVTRRFRDAACRVVASGSEGDEALARLASRQHAIFGGEQAEICGLGRRAREGRVRRGQWRQLYPEVFLLGVDPPSYPAQVLAAALKWSPGVAAGGLSSGWLCGMLEREPAEVHITALDGRNRGPLEGVRLHRPRHAPRQIIWRNGIPVIGPIDTLLSLAAVLPAADLEVACALALRSHTLSRGQLARRLEESPPRPGLRTLRKAVQAPVLTRSHYERLLRGLIVKAELPQPHYNAPVLGKELDLYWPEAKLGIEVDAFSTHGDAASFEDDHKLDVDFGAAGIEIRRFTGLRIEQHPHAVIARIAALLTLRLGGLPPRR